VSEGSAAKPGNTRDALTAALLFLVLGRDLRADADTRPQPETEADCAAFSKDLASGRPVLSTRSELCGTRGSKVAAFRRDRRIHDKHHQITLFAFGRPPTR